LKGANRGNKNKFNYRYGINSESGSKVKGKMFVLDSEIPMKIETKTIIKGEGQVKC